jgi:ethanolamine ammonia-lyase small subunit
MGSIQSTSDPWKQLRDATTARIALGRAGGSLPTSEWLAFKAAHAAARDAVHDPFDADTLAGELSAASVKTVVVSSAANDRHEYLQRPDLGRRLDGPSETRIRALAAGTQPPDLTIIVTDGLSATAIHRHAAPLLAELLPKLQREGWRLSPVVVARFGRVALQDAVGEAFGATLAMSLIGERPGLATPDSMGAYLVFRPRRGNSDANRNCISNIHATGLRPAEAAETIFYLLAKAKQLQLSGVELKDDRTLASAQPPPVLPK